MSTKHDELVTDKWKSKLKDDLDLEKESLLHCLIIQVRFSVIDMSPLLTHAIRGSSSESAYIR